MAESGDVDDLLGPDAYKEHCEKEAH
jgi:hypothetical protein